MTIIMKNNEKIAKIKNERHTLLTMVNDSIKNNSDIVNNDIKTISEILDFDEKSVKKYEAIVNAKELIVSLTVEISEAKTEEEIFNLRKKLNYYINKIKAEIKKRDIDPEYLTTYPNSISYLRKDIAKYIRVLKRNNNINEIENLNNEYETLTDEDKEKLKKMLNAENRYNHRNLNPQEKPKKNTPKAMEEIENLEAENDVTSKAMEENENLEAENEVMPKTHEGLVPTNEQKPIVISPNNALGKSLVPSQDIDSFIDGVVSTIDDVEFLNNRINLYNGRYHIDTIYGYNNSIPTGIINMIRNIPKYKQNKKRIKIMERESQKYYSGADLISYIAYLKKINSVRQGLKSIFNRTYLHSEEGRLLNDHEECAKWLLKYCNENSLNVNFLTRRKAL